jgi:DNA processing protein
MELDAALSWRALALTPGLACRLYAIRRSQSCATNGHIFHASLTELESCSLPVRVGQAINNKDAFKRAEKELAGIRNIPGCGLLNWTEPEYLQNLLQIYDPPQILNMPGLSVVGTRRPTRYGSQMAERLGRDLAARGLVILRGMARGIDAIGHQRARRPTAGQSACWARASTFVTRKKIKSSTKKVLERGAILSEFLLGTHPAPENFPNRNRIVAGMPLGVIVIEGAEFSGSLITAPGHGIWPRSFWCSGKCHANGLATRQIC